MGPFQMGNFLALCGLLSIHRAVALSIAAPEYERIQARGSYTCPSILIGTGDTCDDLAAKCNVSQSDFVALNPSSSCSALVPGKPVCCASGETVFPPIPSNARCYTYILRNGDTCAKIAEAYKITAANIETWNTNTSAWYGCNSLQEGGLMCLSAGEPPMPVSIGDAVCGPQVPGTERPKMWFQIASLNPCSAGQCCSRGGKCGTGADFCSSASSIAASAPAKDTTTKATTTATTAKVTTTTTTTKATTTATTTTTKATTTKAKDTTTKTAASLAPKAVSSTTTPYVDPDVFTTDIPLVDIPLTYLHDTSSTLVADPIDTSTVEKALKVFQAFTGMANSGTTTTSTTKATTTQATTKTTTKATTKTTTKTTTEASKTDATATKITNDIVTVPSGWSLKLWNSKGCNGSEAHVFLQGHNKKLADSDCMKFRIASQLGTDISDTAVSCRRWDLVNGVWKWYDCHSNSLNKPQSWIMSNGLCTVSPNTDCDLVNDISQTYGWRGQGHCQDRGEMDPDFVSFKCYVG
ncbi:unnamed protein product [Penicillium glandicola]